MAALAVDEDWVRNRINLHHENLEDVMSLALPGTYNEKIQSLGSSLRKFTRLIKLDLSRNALESLDGVGSLRCLESLNLYYNNIQSLGELERLSQGCPDLKELDLRLNPVSRTETDYRLMLIHLLPGLEKLDDREVRSGEREAAAQHFQRTPQHAGVDQRSMQAPQITVSPPSRPPTSTTRSVPSRPTVSTMDEDDRRVLDILGQAQDNKDAGQGCEGQGDGGVRGPSATENSTGVVRFATPKAGTEQASADYGGRTGSSLYEEEREAFTLYKGRGHFTANPHPDPSLPVAQTRSAPPPSCGPLSDSDAPVPCPPALTPLLDLVDKYWNGSKSLHKHKKFLSLFEEALRSSGQRSGFESKGQGQAAAAAQVALRRSEERVSLLESQLEKIRLENDSLRRQTMNGHTAAPSSGRGDGDISNNHSLGQEVGELKRENRELAIRLKQYSQMQELTSMLQESHKSLVQTNEHLLRELDDCRQRYQAELTQLSSHRQQQSMALRPPRPPTANGSTV